MKLRGIEEQSERLVDTLRRGGKQAIQGIYTTIDMLLIFDHFIEHLRGLDELVHYYDQEARQYHQERDTKKADLFLTKKKLVQKEVNLILIIYCYKFFHFLVRLIHLLDSHQRQFHQDFDIISYTYLLYFFLKILHIACVLIPRILFLWIKIFNISFAYRHT